jgi:hypothetical protein
MWTRYLHHPSIDAIKAMTPATLMTIKDMGKKVLSDFLQSLESFFGAEGAEKLLDKASALPRNAVTWSFDRRIRAAGPPIG